MTEQDQRPLGMALGDIARDVGAVFDVLRVALDVAALAAAETVAALVVAITGVTAAHQVARQVVVAPAIFAVAMHE